MGSSSEYGIAPHEEELVEEWYDVEHPLIAGCKTGCRYVVEVIVGGGGGHNLTVNEFEFLASACFKKKIEDNPCTEEEINPDNLESISISIERETFDFESNDWHEVARSEPVDAVVFEEDSGAQLKFKWYDQGW